MAKRFGAVIVFKPNVPKDLAAQKLRELRGLIELGGSFTGGKWVEHTDPAKLLNTFNDEHGGPVWYIP